MKKEIKVDLEKIQEQLQVLHDFCDITVYKITETTANEIKTYYASNVTMEINETIGLISLFDAEGIMCKDGFKVANMFCLDNVIESNMEYTDKKCKLHYTIKLTGATIELWSKTVDNSLQDYQSVPSNVVLPDDEEDKEITGTLERYFIAN